MLNELLERYWNAAFTEGKEGRDHDTVDGLAQRTLSEIHAEVLRLVEAEREACAAECDDIGNAAASKNRGNADFDESLSDLLLRHHELSAVRCAEAIRSRSNAELRGRPLADGPA